MLFSSMEAWSTLNQAGNVVVVALVRDDSSGFR